MHIFEKDYTYLLEHLIPHHRLSFQLRRDIENALASGFKDDLRRAAVLALEELNRSGYLRRADAREENGSVVVTYLRGSGLYQLRVHVPVGLWESLGISRQGPAAPPREPADQLEAAVVPVDGTFDIFPDVIRSFSINDGDESTIQRVDGLMGLLSRWLRFGAGRVLLVSEKIGEATGSELYVKTLSEKHVLEPAVYDRCRRLGEPVVFGEAEARELGVAVPELPLVGSPPHSSRQVAVVPLFTLNEFWGILEMWFDAAQAAPPISHRIKIATGLIGQLIENTVRLEKLTSIDKLTRIYNRQFYDVQVQIEIERATRSGGSLTMLVLDIDDFKQINDELGHRKGDEALALVADLIKKNLRKVDLAFRYGGEEFVILLPGAAAMEAIHTAERLRIIVSEFDEFLDESGARRSVSVSIGGAVFPDDAKTEEELFKKADEALYRAKKLGKNRVQFYQD